VERRTAVLILGGSALLATLVVAAAVVLGRSRPRGAPDAPGPAPAGAPDPVSDRLASVPPAEAWKLHEARVADLEAQDLEAPERERRTAEWFSEIRRALKTWQAKTPSDHVALARFAIEAAFPDEALKHVEAAASDPGEAGAQAARIELTLRLQRHEPERARAVLDRVRKSARPDELAAVEGAVFEEAVQVARARVEGATPDDSARRALEIAEELARTPEDQESVALARAYVALAVDPHAWRAFLPTGIPEGACAVVVSDDFALGEPILPSVMKRWSKSMPVVLVGRQTGEVREGMRRAKAGPMEEARVFGRRARELGVKLAGLLEAGSKEEQALGISGPGAWVLLVDREGRLVARLSGIVLDPRPLDPVVRRLTG
jgi:hypothetical protein